jgi:hypothetical protein
MRSQVILALILMPLWISGCSSIEQKGTVTIEGRGAKLLTDRGDQLMSTGKYAKKVGPDYSEGFAKGISDQIKREYWNQQQSQAGNPDGHIVLYGATIPSRIDSAGVRRVEQNVTVPIVE